MSHTPNTTTKSGELPVGAVSAPVPLFQAALGEGWALLPEPLKALHSQTGQWRGSVQVQRGQHWLARLMNRWLRLPQQTRRAPAVVSMRSHRCPVSGKASEKWLRQFGEDRNYATVLSLHRGVIRERFGAAAIAMSLKATRLGLSFDAKRVYLLGVPMPKLFTPRVDAYEHVHGQRCYFSVKVSLPLVGLLIHYHGWLLVES